MDGARSNPAQTGHTAAVAVPFAGSAPSAQELALQRLDALPTLSSIAARLLTLTSDDQASATEVIDLVSSDPALAASVVRMCRCAPQGRTAQVNTIERAVLLLGFDAIRSIVLTVQVFECLGAEHGTTDESLVAPRSDRFDRLAFWRHSIAVSAAAERLAIAGVTPHRVNPAEASLAGLLHDLGLLALHVCMPQAIDSVCAQAASSGAPFNQLCRRAIGIDVPTAGKRLAEHWNLPHLLSDAMWLHAQPVDALPELPHRPLIGLIALADVLARTHYISPIDQGVVTQDAETIARMLDVSIERLDPIVAAMPEDVARRGEALGIDVPTDASALVQAVGKANRALGRSNRRLREQADASHRQARTLRAIRSFHATARPSESLVTVMGKVVKSASGLFGAHNLCILFQPRSGQQWTVLRFAGDGRLQSNDQVDPPQSADLSSLASAGHVSLQAAPMLEWIRQTVQFGRDDGDALRLLPLQSGLGMNVLLVHNGDAENLDSHDGAPAIGTTRESDVVALTWAAAIASAAQHEGARRLGEQLAESNAILTETQEELSRTRALASVGEIAAGAAHEMNNPLTVISGRSQLLVDRLTRLAAGEQQVDQSLVDTARQVMVQAHRLSNLISGLKILADPAQPHRCACSLLNVLTDVVSKFHVECGDAMAIELQSEAAQELEPVWIDPGQIGQALAELIRNGVEAEGSTRIVVSVQIAPDDDRLTIQVTDNGPGLSEHVRAHAFDPFFSFKSAGRQPGFGLAQARRLVEAQNGHLSLANAPGGGAVARIVLTQWRCPADSGEHHRSSQPPRRVA